MFKKHDNLKNWCHPSIKISCLPLLISFQSIPHIFVWGHLLDQPLCVSVVIKVRSAGCALVEVLTLK